MPKLVNRARMTTATVGTGALVLGSAMQGYRSFAAAGVSNGDVVRYTIEDGGNWEIGTGTYTAATATLSRTPSESSSGGTAISLSGNATVFVTAAAADLQELVTFAEAFVLPTVDGTAGQVLVTSGSGALTFSGAPVITGGTINGTPIGGTTPAAGSFTTLGATGNLTVSGTFTLGGTALTATITEVNYVGGVTAPIQTQINARVARSSATGSAVIPSGTQAQRDVSPSAGFFRFNSDLGKFEGFNGTAWGAVGGGGGATGGGSDAVFFENDQNVTANYTITAGKNAMSAGPITIAAGITVAVPAGSVWTVV